MKLTKGAVLKVKEQVRQKSIDGQFALRSGNATSTKQLLPIFKGGTISQNKYTNYAINSSGDGVPMSTPYCETQEVSFFCRTENTTKDVLKFGEGGTSYQISGAFSGLINIELDINGIVVGGEDGYIGEAFLSNLKTTFRLDPSTSSMTQLGTAGGIYTSISKDTNVGTQSVYVAQNNTIPRVNPTHQTTYKSITFMVSNTGNKIIEWTGTAKFKAYKTQLYQPYVNGGGALYQNMAEITFQNGNLLLWN